MFWLGKKYFIASLKRTKSATSLILTILGLSITISCLIVTIALMRGFYSGSMQRILQNCGHVQVYTDSLEMLNDIRLNAVIQCVKRYDTYGMIPGLYTPINTTFMRIQDIHFILGAGLTSTQMEEDGIYIGYRLAKALGIYDLSRNYDVGICFDIFNQRIIKKYKLQGIFNTGFYDFDAHQVFISSDLPPVPHLSPSISVYLPDPKHSRQYQERLDKIGISSEIWQETHASINNMFKVNARGVSLMISVFILASAIQSITNLVSLMHMKRRDFEILEQMGMSRLQMFKMIFGYGSLTNLLVILFSILIGLGICSIYNIFTNILEKYGYSIIDQDSFWIAKIMPEINIFDIFFIEVFSFAFMSIVVAVFAMFLTRKKMLDWSR